VPSIVVAAISRGYGYVDCTPLANMANNNGTDNHTNHDDQRATSRSRRDEPHDPHSTERYGQGQSGYMAGRRDDQAVDTIGRDRSANYREQQQRVWDSGARDYSIRTHPNDGPRGYGFDDGDGSGYNDRGYSDRGYGGQGYSNQGFGSEGAANQGYFGTDYHNRGYNYPRHPQPSSQGGHRGKGPMNFAYSDEKLRERICEMLADHDLIDPSNVDIQVKSGEVTITGTIEDRHQKRLIEDMVDNVPGVQDIHMSVKVDRNRSKAQTTAPK